ncbi:hypothetical protein K435DRAFT_583338, partial [Dendrothele bispora CBS 962.96]
GCCMHKEMNAFKGGVAAMEAWWGANGIEPPARMYNWDNAAASTLAPGTAALKRAEEKSKGGAIKVSDLAGAVFRHKDRKRGQQDTLRFYFDRLLGFTIEFPDTNNTRFQSHAEAAAVIITYLQYFLEFLRLVEDNKNSRSLNHMERNVLRGLECRQTLHEFAVITLYHQCISVPYMREIRGPIGSTEQNALCLGPFHERLKTHLRLLIDEPELIVSRESFGNYKKAAFDGQLWDRLDAIYAVQSYLPELEHLKPLFVEFCKGALQTWERFTAEYAEGGEISKLSVKNKKRAAMHKTNDLSEGSFGKFCRIQWSNPSMTLSQHNSREMIKNPGTVERLEEMNDRDWTSIRKIARKWDELGEDRRNKVSIAENMNKVAEGKRQKDKEKAQRQEQTQQKVD